MSFMSLTELADEEGSDKGTLGPSPAWRAHNDTDVYDAFLRPYRNKPITLLEIGLRAVRPTPSVAVASAFM